MKVRSRGIELDLPPGWEAEIDGGAGEGTGAPSGEVLTPRTHIANFPMPPVRGDFGSGAVEQMIDGDVLLCLLEEAGEAVGSRLHGHAGIPRLAAGDFSPQAMQRPLKGQSGAQVFFHDQGRAFVLYVVVGSHLSRASRIDAINQVLAGITLTAD
ncbi:MAG TPA: hypothetical protein DCS55_16315 [Acidimicrobiaceae bacterium]|nr:hypothetical protein [Acidimicrobiaceae bacterium]